MSVVSAAAGTSPRQRASRKEIFGWAMFDFANQAYTLLIITVVFGELFTTVIVGDRGDDYRLANLLWSLALAVSYLLVVITGPLCGAVMDYQASKKRFLFASYLATVATTAMLYFVAPGYVVLGLLLIVVSNYAYSMGESFIAAFLPDLGPPQDLGKISGFGWALGYVGGLFAAGFTLVALGEATAENFERIRWVGPFAAGFFLITAIPTFLWVRERGTPQPPGMPYHRIAWERVSTTLHELRRFRDLGIFLVSLLFSMAGVYIIIAFAFIYGAQVIGWDESIRNLMFIIVQITAAAGALGFGFIQDRIGTKVTYLITLMLWVAAIFQVFDGANVVARGVLRGTGDVVWPAWVGILTAWVATPPLTWLLGWHFGLGALGGWIGLCAEIIVGAAILNGLKVVEKRIENVRLVASGAGAAALACLELLVKMGMRRENIVGTDIKGVVYRGRKEEMDPDKARFAVETKARTLEEVIGGADIFLGLSAGGVLKPGMVKKMAERPLILALANPEPEIRPELAREARPDCVIATGRTDYPNQVNNVLCFPFIFRGALDVGATEINEAMKIACVRAIAELARSEVSEVVIQAYGGESAPFGREYLIPRPFDPRLILQIAPAVAEAAMASGVATRPIEDLTAYREKLSQFVYLSGSSMQPLFATAKRSPKSVVYAEGEDERVLRAAQVVVDEVMARPTLVGRREVVTARLERLGLRLRVGEDFDLVDPNNDSRYREYSMAYHRLAERKGVTPQIARLEMRRRNTLIGAMLVHMGAADAMLCGVVGHYDNHLRFIDEVIGLAPHAKNYAAMNMLLLPQRTVFICDTYVNYDPTAEQIAEMTVLAAEEIRRFGIEPRVALLSHSSFGTANTPSAVKMRRALGLIEGLAPGLEVEGEMRGDAALSQEIRDRVFPNARLKGDANLLVMPTLDAANIAFNLLKTAAGDGITVGPILLGVARPMHILTPSATVRRIVNMTALTVVGAAAQLGEQKKLL